MLKKIIISSLSVFILWSVLDFVVHGIYLKEAYEQTANLWRPLEEQKMGLNSLVVYIAAAMFSLIYILLVDAKSMSRALLYGFLVGISAGIMSYGFYAFSPIPYFMAAIWFVSSLAQSVLAGALLGLLVKE